MRCDLLCLATALAGSFGCQPPPSGASAPGRLEHDVVALVDDGFDPIGARREALGGAGPHERVLYLHFDGLTVVRGADAPGRSSSPIVPRDVVVPPFDPTGFKAPALEVRARIVERVKQHFARFAVKVVWARPAPTVDYTMCVVGGLPSLLDLPPAVAGIAPLDCDDARGGNVVFTFSDTLAPALVGSEARAVAAIADACSHEFGHALGLGHTIDETDLMATTLSEETEGFAGPTPVTGGNDPQCVRGPVQDGRALLERTVGAQLPEGAPPLAILGVVRREPPGTLGVSLSVAIPGRSVDAVDVYADGARVATLTRPPLRAELRAETDQPVTLRAVARDRGIAVAETSVVTSSADVAGAAPECRLHADCAAPEACVDGRCTDAAATLSMTPTTPPAPDGGAPAAAADGGVSRRAPALPAGCAVTARPSAGVDGALVWAAALLALCVALRRRAARGARS
jgi:hypothetical protein